MDQALSARTVNQDVRELGALVGDVIREHASRDDFETVETLRTASIAYREDDAESREGLYQVLDRLSPERESIVARAFTTYFELINLAEERERVRVLREASHEGTLDDGLEAAAEALAESPDRAERVLSDVLVEPTFTAHPTEARRKTVKAKLRAVAEHIETLDERRLTEKERTQVERAIDAEVVSLWQTPQVRTRRPEPTDEARNVGWYLEHTLFDVIGEVYDELETALEEVFDRPPSVPKLVEFRSWAGSDRDGNPFVTPDVTAETLDRQRRVVLSRYLDALSDLSGVLSQDGSRITVGEAFEKSLAADRERLPGVARAAEDRYPREPYRQKLQLMGERIGRVDDVRPGGYDDPAEFSDDLSVLARSALENGAESVVEEHVNPLRRQAEAFGFSLASLDLRDHRKNHTEAITESLALEGLDYGSLSEAERVETLTEAIAQDEPVIDVTRYEDEEAELSDTTRTVLELFDRLAGWQAEYGTDAIDTYCISMTEEASHVLEVLFLADQAGVITLPEYAGIDVVPLLETEYALSGARRIMGTLFENEVYTQTLSARGGLQEIMLGYSDSNKENGFLAANWDLYRNQRRLAEIADEYDVTLRLFHGRGGSISRGGGPMNEALLALPPESVSGQVKFTEQGEAIAEKYGNPRIAERNVEQMVNAQIRSRRRALDGENELIEEQWTEAMETMAEAARTEYRDLLESEGFVRYFEQATPITVIEELNLGSRPASRSGQRTVEDLRAIPWVFSWTQSRCILTGWYALATGIDAYLDDGGEIDTLQEMYQKWPFFRTTLDNAALSLARTEMEIAAEYATIAEEGLEERFFPRLESEYDRAVSLVAEITGRESLLARRWLEESLRRRNPYVDPLNLLQTHLLKQTHRTETEERTLRLTVKGIAAGMKNTG
ncbi:phosphoenolpyruvate carboxylase [Natronorarus salvus]|uniref:phosphoenolpyruvate carboxylase n=1 Tax=Natronorarus salvus TaxID=3117733 RepID=UPI002F264BCD